MKAFIRALCSASVMVGMLGVAGCGPDNESEGQKANAKLGDAGKPTGEASKVQAPPATSADRAALGPQGTVNSGLNKQAKPAPK